MAETLIWGLEASPYLLKMEACLKFKGVVFRRLPRDGGRLENIRTFLQLERAKKAGWIKRFPAIDKTLDEYPGVPYYKPGGGNWHYDSTGLALWLDQQIQSPMLFPEQAKLNFVARLIDEAFDEFGLYMVHHNRWITAARDNRMGEVTTEEFSKLAPWPVTRTIRRELPRRQVRRCPYLFSVAPEGYSDEVEPLLIPPSRDGFPPTHELLNESWHAYLEAIEGLLEKQPYLLGDQFTVADASAYGQLGMNLIDRSAIEIVKARAPRVFNWLESIQNGEHVGSSGELRISDALNPLLEIIFETFVPLMEQNEAAYEKALAEGENLFNEKAFNQNRALYQGELRGHPYRAAIKTFQVKVWRDLKSEWSKINREPLSMQSIRDL